MAIKNNMRGGAGAGRGDNPHPQWQQDQASLAHADGFIGPRIGETYGDGRYAGQEGYMAPTLKGGVQRSPASGFVNHGNSSNSAGTADRMAHLDRNLGSSSPRMLQHKATGNIVETWQDHTGTQRLNKFGTSASGRSMVPADDTNMAPSGYASSMNINSDDYTDVTDTVRETQTYKKNRNG